jgi:hypothetical protein
MSRDPRELSTVHLAIATVVKIISALTTAMQTGTRSGRAYDRNPNRVAREEMSRYTGELGRRLGSGDGNRLVIVLLLAVPVFLFFCFIFMVLVGALLLGL